MANGLLKRMKMDLAILKELRETKKKMADYCVSNIEFQLDGRNGKWL